MANGKTLVDNDVRHLATCFRRKSVVQLEDVGLRASSTDQEILDLASARRLLIVTNNKRDFTKGATKKIAQTSPKIKGCTQIHGMIIVVPSDAIVQERVLRAALKSLRFEGREIGLKNVQDECLQVLIDNDGQAKVTKLPRCQWCEIRDAKAS
jgi:hypothetical protein